jgi:hypothetical protein
MDVLETPVLLEPSEPLKLLVLFVIPLAKPVLEPDPIIVLLLMVKHAKWDSLYPEIHVLPVTALV